MAVKTIRVSDLSGKDIEAGDEVELRVLSYPDLSEAVALDASKVEIDRLRVESHPLALLEIVTSEGTEQIAISAEQFAKTVRGDIYEVLSQATRVVVAAPYQPEPTEPPRQRRPRGSGPAARTDKVDYSDPAFAGRPKRGITSDAEKETIRTQFDIVNQNLESAGIRVIDLSDIAMVEKYGLQELAKERGVTPAAK